LARCGSLRLGGARPAGRHTRVDRPLVLSGRASCLTQARAHSLVTRGRLRLPRRRHFSAVGRRRQGRPQHVTPVNRRTSNVAAPQRLRRRIFIGGDTKLPRLPPLDAVVVSIVLGDLAFLVLRHVRGVPPLHHGLVLIEKRLFRERCLGQNKVRALQLQQQVGVKVSRGRQVPRRSTS
jgi:hypothetical protein